jgi:hypothetical protein
MFLVKWAQIDDTGTYVRTTGITNDHDEKKQTKINDDGAKNF